MEILAVESLQVADTIADQAEERYIIAPRLSPFCRTPMVLVVIVLFLPLLCHSPC